MKNLVNIAASLLLVASSVAALAATNQPDSREKNAALLASLFPDPVVARGKGVEIKLSEVEEAFLRYRARMAESKKSVAEEQRLAIERRLLDELVVTKLMVLRASPEDKAKAKQQTDLIVGTYRTNAGSEAALRRQLKIRGTSLDQFAADVLEEETARVVIDREFKSKVAITDAQVKDFYNDGVDAVVKIMQEELERMAKDSSTTPGQLAATKKRIDELKRANLNKLQVLEAVRVSHILVATRDLKNDEPLPDTQKKAKRDLAQKILLLARAGENWTNLITKYSEDPYLPRTGGFYLVSRDGTYGPEFTAASFSLTNNQISDLVTGALGYHILKQHEKLPGKKLEFEKAADEIRRALLDQEFARQTPELFGKIKKEAGVEILEPKYRFSATAEELLQPPGEKLKAN